MPLLIAASLIWSFSFSIIKEELGGLPPSQVAFWRLGIATLAFAPFLRVVEVKRVLLLMAIGAVQFGAMYLAYIESYQHLAAHEVALFTIFTPIWVLVFDGLLPGGLRRTWTLPNIVAVAAAVLGAAIIRYHGDDRPDFGRGFALVQLANVCFAIGQVAYRRWGARAGSVPRLRDDAAVMAWSYLGATLVAGSAVLLSEGSWRVAPVHGRQLAALGYLGVVASGLGFFLWNSGARRVGVGLLSVFNNLKVPLAVAVSIFVFGEEASSTRLFLGGALVLFALLYRGKEQPAAD